MGLDNYPPGVTGREPQITGEWPCLNCGIALPEEADCPECGKPMNWLDDCWVCACGKTLPGDVCPDGCHDEDPADDYDVYRDRLAEGLDREEP